MEDIFSKLQNFTKDYAIQQERIKSLEDKYHSKCDEVDALTLEKIEARRTIVQLQGKLDSTQDSSNENKVLRETVQSLETALQEKCNECEALIKKNQTEAVNNQALEALQQSIDSLKSENAILQKDYEAMSVSAKQAKDELHKKNNQVAELETTVHDLNTEVSYFKVRFQEASIEHDAERHKKESYDLSIKLSEAQRQIEELTKKNEENQSHDDVNVSTFHKKLEDRVKEEKRKAREEYSAKFLEEMDKMKKEREQNDLALRAKVEHDVKATYDAAIQMLNNKIYALEEVAMYDSQKMKLLEKNLEDANQKLMEANNVRMLAIGDSSKPKNLDMQIKHMMKVVEELDCKIIAKTNQIMQLQDDNRNLRNQILAGHGSVEDANGVSVSAVQTIKRLEAELFEAKVLLQKLDEEHRENLLQVAKHLQDQIGSILSVKKNNKRLKNFYENPTMHIPSPAFDDSEIENINAEINAVADVSDKI